MIRRNADDRIIRNTLFFKGFHKIIHCLFKLKVRRYISTYRLRVRKIVFRTPCVHDISIFPWHVIISKSVYTMTAYRHVINIKRLFVNVHRQSCLHQFQITCRPFRADKLLKTISNSHISPAVAQLCMCLMPVVIGVGAVVESHAKISLVI